MLIFQMLHSTLPIALSKAAQERATQVGFVLAAPVDLTCYAILNLRCENESARCWRWCLNASPKCVHAGQMTHQQSSKWVKRLQQSTFTQLPIIEEDVMLFNAYTQSSVGKLSVTRLIHFPSDGQVKTAYLSVKETTLVDW